MSWASRRRFLITAIGGAVVLTVLAFILIPTFYRAPSCSDGSQNQGEQGVDCGGPCHYLCQPEQLAPTVLFVRPVSPMPGRTDVIAYVDNQNPTAAARNVPYEIKLYASDHTLVAKSGGLFDLPPHTTVPVFVPGLFSGTRTVSEAFLTIATSSIQWFLSTNTPLLPQIGKPEVGGTTNAPRITAILTNAGTAPMLDVKVIVAVFDASGNVIAASQTVIASLVGQASVPAVFTWNEPFSAAPTRIDVLPLVPLSS